MSPRSVAGGEAGAGAVRRARRSSGPVLAVFGLVALATALLAPRALGAALPLLLQDREFGQGAEGQIDIRRFEDGRHSGRPAR